MAPNLTDEDFYIYTPVLRGMCAMADLKTNLDLNDLMDLHELIRFQDAVQVEQQARAAKG